MVKQFILEETEELFWVIALETDKRKERFPRLADPLAVFLEAHVLR